jgi:hypothetical protein
MNKYELTLWTDEMVFTRGALSEQLDRYSKRWRETFMKYDAGIAEVYIPAIRACQSMIKKIDRAMPPIKEGN